MNMQTVSTQTTSTSPMGLAVMNAPTSTDAYIGAKVLEISSDHWFGDQRIRDALAPLPD